MTLEFNMWHQIMLRNRYFDFQKEDELWPYRSEKLGFKCLESWLEDHGYNAWLANCAAKAKEESCRYPTINSENGRAEAVIELSKEKESLFMHIIFNDRDTCYMTHNIYKYMNKTA